MSNNLSEKAMLVSLNISIWSARKLDKNVTNRIESEYGAYDAGRFNKLLIDKVEIKKIEKIANAARTFHYFNTLPWNNAGAILLNSNYFDYTNKMNEFKSRFDDAVNEFIANYDNLVEKARTRLNNMFNHSDYPFSNELVNKYKFNVDFYPVPVANDFRVELQENEVEKIRQDIEKKQQELVENAMKDVWKRLYDVIKHVSEKLKGDGIFRDSIIGNVIKLVEVLPKLNIANDKELMELRKKVENELTGVNPDSLRANKGLRKDTAKKADEILKKMEGYFG